MKKLKIDLLFKIFFIVFTCIYCLLFYKYNKSKYKIDETNFKGYIKNIKIDGNKLSLIVHGKEDLIVNYYFETLEEKKKFNLKLGDYIKINGVLNVPQKNTNFNLFNYQKYLLGKKIYYTLSAKEIIKYKNHNFLYKIKNIIISKIDSIPNNGYIKSLILGDNNSVDKDSLNSYRQNGVSHLFAISGMHVIFIIKILEAIMNKIIKKEEIKYTIIFLILFFYSFIASFSISIIRAVLMFIIGKICKLLKYKIKPIETFIFTLCISLIINPYNIYNISFKYSFMVSLFLIIFSDLINKRKTYIGKLFMTSLIAFLASIPIQINNFFSINILSIIFNMFFVPFFTFIFFPITIIVFIFPCFSYFYSILINILETISMVLSNIKFGTITLCHINIFIIIWYYFIILIFLKKSNYLYGFILVMTIFIHTNINYLNKYIRVSVLDVGQGDSILISLNYNKGNILIDTGGKVNYAEEEWKQRKKYSIAENTIIPYLKSLGIKKINYLVLTHGDYDHMGEAINLINNYQIDNVIFNCGEYNNLENELIELLDKNNINYSSCINKLNINDYDLKFLNTKEYDNENDNSSVLYFNYKKFKFLFMGDAGKIREKDILEKYNLKNITFLKVGHHGSNTSSSKEFINEIAPKYSLISVGRNNRYGHPKSEVLDNLLQSNIYRTDLNGGIEIKINNNKYQIKSCN